MSTRNKNYYMKILMPSRIYYKSKLSKNKHEKLLFDMNTIYHVVFRFGYHSLFGYLNRFYHTEIMKYIAWIFCV